MPKSNRQLLVELNKIKPLFKAQGLKIDAYSPGCRCHYISEEQIQENGTKYLPDGACIYLSPQATDLVIRLLKKLKNNEADIKILGEILDYYDDLPNDVRAELQETTFGTFLENILQKTDLIYNIEVDEEEESND